MPFSAWVSWGRLRAPIAFSRSPGRLRSHYIATRDLLSCLSLLAATASRLGLPKRKSQRPVGFLGVSASQLRQQHGDSTSGSGDTGGAGGGAEPPPVDSGPPEAGRPDSPGTANADGGPAQTPPEPERPAPADQQREDPT